MWYWHKCRHIDQWSRIDNTETNPPIYDHMIFNKGAKTTQWGKTMSSKNLPRTTKYPHVNELF